MHQEHYEGDGKLRAMLQIEIDEDFGSGCITHEEWSRRFDHLSSHLWMLPFYKPPVPISTLPIIG